MRKSRRTMNCYLLVCFSFISYACGSNNDHSADSSLTDDSPSALDKNPESSSNTCLTECNPPKGVLVSFSRPISLAPNGCTASDLNVFSTDTGITAFVQANCSGTSSIYSMLLTHTGEQISSTSSFDGICPFGKGGVDNFAAARGSNGYLLSITCKTGQKSYSAHVAATDKDGVLEYSRPIVSSMTSVQPIAVSWSHDAGAYGVARPGFFQRFDQSAYPLGGSVSVPTEGNLIELSSWSGGWNILQGTTDYYDYTGSYCSKISTVGTLQCDRLQLTETSNYYTMHQVIDGEWIIGTSSNGSIYVGGYNPLTCSNDEMYPFGKVVGEKIGKFFDATTISNNNYIIALYSGIGPALNLSFLDLNRNAIVSTTAVLDGDKIHSARVFKAQNRIYVVTATENDALLTWTQQAIKP